MMIRWMVFVLFFAGLVSLFLYETSMSVQDSGIAMISAKARPLLVAIDAYQAAEGSYPDSLNQLIPRYMSCLPQSPPESQGWRYSTWDNNLSYGIEIRCRNQMFRYSSDLRQWTCNESMF